MSVRGRAVQALRALALLTACTPPLYAAEGEGITQAILPGQTLDVAYDTPSGCAPRAILIVFASKDRDYRAFRDQSEGLAQHSCSVLLAPYFSQRAFPPAAYQRGGFPEQANTPSAARFIAPLEQWAQSFAGNKALPIILIGHSAGAQFLNRVTAYKTGTERGIILMNPGSTVEPTRDIAMPYGFEDVTDTNALKSYLARPVIFLLGDQDTKASHFGAGAQNAIESEGTTRLARGLNTYNAAKQQAQTLNTPFNWHIALVPGVGHDDGAMLGSPQLERTVETLINRGSLP